MSKQVESKGCHGKNRYMDMGSASFMAQRRSLITGDNIQPYKCHFCKLYHIGHTSGRKHLTFGKS